jgi:hypothetical protein
VEEKDEHSFDFDLLVLFHTTPLSPPHLTIQVGFDKAYTRRISSNSNCRKDDTQQKPERIFYGDRANCLLHAKHRSRHLPLPLIPPPRLTN